MDADPPNNVSTPDRPAKRRRGWKRIFSISIIAAFVLGIAFSSIFSVVMDWTSTEEFCISCHEMKDTVYPEYQMTIHNKNRTGVRAVCVDCHLPKGFFPKILHKIKATNDIWHTMLGSIDTPEKFEAKRAELAQREWLRLKANDSQECRDCHKAEFFDIDIQSSARAKKQHQEELLTKKQTCIDCHKGIAHREPEIPDPGEAEEAVSPDTAPPPDSAPE
ncbi:MAG: NapC/NirT family cytochrome c [Azoarcus sp.]|jgi:cytochrome c-type protein NapC|nr:NapC/NirT family cytochrome c [Azoarcus sp.]